MVPRGALNRGLKVGSFAMTYYDNGTFETNWRNNQDYMTRVGFQYGDNGPGVDHNTKHYAVDYKYTKTGSAQNGYIGVYGWTVNPQVEYYIVDDWYSKPNEQDIGEKFGEIEVDGATYTIHAFLRQQERSTTGTSTFLQIFSVRQTSRQCGHIDISAHFKKCDELFTGQTKRLRGSKGGGSTQLKFGKVTEVMLMTEAGGDATGSVKYTYFDMTDKASSSSVVPKSSSSEDESSSSENHVSSSSEVVSSGSEVVSSSAKTQGSSSSEAVSSSAAINSGSSSVSEEKSGSSTKEKTDAVPLLKFLTDDFGHSPLVFDMQGRYLGTVDYMNGMDLEQVLLEKFRRPGMYLLRRGKTSQVVRVTAF